MIFKATLFPWGILTNPLFNEIINNYDLSINKYKEIVYEAVQYEPTDVIIGKIDALESEIQGELAELKKLLDV